MMIGQFEEAVYEDRVKPVLEADGREKWRSKLFTLNSIQKILPFWGMCRNSQSCLGWPKQLKQASRADPIPADFEGCNTAIVEMNSR
jgi:hypothetical protein